MMSWGWDVDDQSPDPGAQLGLPLAAVDSFAEIQERVRLHNAGELKKLLRILDPYVQGLVGPVNPRFIEVYVKVLSELGRLYRVFDRPPVAPEPEPDPAVEAAQARKALEGLQEQVLGQLLALEGKQGPGVNGRRVS